MRREGGSGGSSPSQLFLPRPRLVETLHLHQGALGGYFVGFCYPCVHTLNFSSRDIKADVYKLSRGEECFQLRVKRRPLR